MYKRWKYPLVLTMAWMVVLWCSVPEGSWYGSMTDWFSQHVALAETIRTACREQGTLLPSYLPLGGGSNGFAFAYYGYLRPDIVVGCLFPEIPMIYLVTGYMLAGYLASVLIFYGLLLLDGRQEFTAFWGGMLFLLAACFFHTHRQVMFVNYMPFFLAALWMVKKKRYGWVCIFLALVYCNSFYYAIAVLAALGWYWYREEGSAFFQRYVKAAALSVGMAAMLLLPVGLVILEHRREGTHPALAELLRFQWDFDSLLYSPYGMGLTAVCLYAVFFGLGIKELRRDSLCILFVCGFAVAAWLLNGTLYARSKILMPFVPLVVLHCVRVFAYIEKEKPFKMWLPFVPLAAVVFCYSGRTRFFWIAADVSVLFFGLLLLGKKKYRKAAYLILLVLPVCFFLRTAQTETYVPKEMAEEFDLEKREWNFFREPFYRFDSIHEPLSAGNRDAAEGREKSTMYSSIYNASYAKVYYDLLMTPVQINNRMAILAADNPFLLQFMGVRYVETTKEQVPDGYRIVERQGELVVAENDKVLPMAYLVEETMDERAFEKLDDYGKLDALMRMTIVQGGEKTAFQSQMKERKITWKDCELPTGLSIEETEAGVYEIDAGCESRLSLEFTEPVCGEVLLLSFRVENRASGAVVIDINQIRNKLSGKNAAYPNGNEVFHYQFSESGGGGITGLELVFAPGKYQISEVTWHTYDKKLLAAKEIVEVKSEETKGNEILACVAEHENESLFVTSIPRQRGMVLQVDGETVPIRTVNHAFVGAVIPAGCHEITLAFCPPGLRLGYAVSFLSLCLFLWRKSALFRFRIFCAKGFHGHGFHHLRGKRSVTVIGCRLRNFIYHIHPLDKLTESRISAV